MSQFKRFMGSTDSGRADELLGGQRITNRVHHTKRELHDVLEVGVANWRLLSDKKYKLTEWERELLQYNLVESYRQALAIFFELSIEGVDTEVAEFLRKDPQYLAVVSKFYTGTAHTSVEAFAQNIRIEFNRFVAYEMTKR